MKQATTNNTTATNTTMGQGHRKPVATSLSPDDTQHAKEKSLNGNDVSQWTSGDVQHWIKLQCKKFELKKAIVNQFEMNGQALALLTKHDFLRRAPDGGEVLYYALQRLINPNKVNNARLDQKGLKTNTLNTHPRIVEVNGDYIDPNDGLRSSSTVPIIEEPDDPPIRRSRSDTHQNDAPPLRPFPHHPHFHRSFITEPNAFAAHHYHSQYPGYPSAFVYAHPQIFQQYYPMMHAQGVLIEILDEAEMNGISSNRYYGPVQEQLYMVTMNGQRQLMNEGQVRQLVAELYQRQVLQNAQQQQQQYQPHFQWH